MELTLLQMHGWKAKQMNAIHLLILTNFFFLLTKVSAPAVHTGVREFVTNKLRSVVYIYSGMLLFRGPHPHPLLPSILRSSTIYIIMIFSTAIVGRCPLSFIMGSSRCKMCKMPKQISRKEYG